MTHKVRFEPVDIEIEVEEDETILNAAFRQGVMLMHGCKEGQCSSCKSYLLEGELDMERYSTFALADYEREEGYVLLCRAHAYGDMVVELINYDEDMLRSGIFIQDVDTVVDTIEALTHDMWRLVLELVEPSELAFTAGQYVDITIPGSSRTRSFSMANSPISDDHHLELLIKHYPGGRFSGLLEGSLRVGDTLHVKGPYGTSTLRTGSSQDLLLIGGGAGMAPLLAIVRSLADAGSSRKISYYYGARTKADLFMMEELASLEERLPGFRFIPALSEEAAGQAWMGERGLVTEVVERHEADLTAVDAYLCGPPPMVDAAVPLLVARGVQASHIYTDKFTTAADAESRFEAEQDALTHP